VVGRILCNFVVDPGGSSLFSHKRSLPTAGELDPPNFAFTDSLLKNSPAGRARNLHPS
jgi:hypothetical protein